MSRQYGILYMGGKRKLSKALVGYMLRKNPKAKYFYDLFGGGGAMSFEALHYNQLKEVHYNEFNGGVVTLLKDILKNGVSEDYYKWVSREDFNKNKTSDCLHGGICKVLWSFGGSQNSYIYGKEIEEDKELINDIIVNSSQSSVSKFNSKNKTHLKLIPKDDTIEKRRKRIQRQLTIIGKKENRIGRVSKLQHILSVNLLNRITEIGAPLEKLRISNMSYEDVTITPPQDETIIYLDPPYEGTKKYEHDICHQDLLAWIKRQKCVVYVSSYKFDGLREVYSKDHRSTISATAKNSVDEKLFVWDGRIAE